MMIAKGGLSAFADRKSGRWEGGCLLGQLVPPLGYLVYVFPLCQPPYPWLGALQSSAQPPPFQ